MELRQIKKYLKKHSTANNSLENSILKTLNDRLMITKNIKFKNFLIKKKFFNISKKIKLLLDEK